MSEPLVSPDWLAARLERADVRVLDASWFLPSAGRDAEAEFRAGHIPGAAFFDIDAAADRASDLPHMLPSAAGFAKAASQLGIGDGDTVVAYDRNGFVASARAWWMFRAMGHEDVVVLDGGFEAWRAAGGSVEAGEPRPQPAGAFTARPEPSLVADFDAVRRGAQVVDARSATRFRGEANEPRPGLRRGHIPGSRNLPYAELIGPDGRMLPSDGVRGRFDAAGVELDRPIVTSCGSGVTACVLALALARIGVRNAAVYDGSWTEWGARADAPVAVG